MQQILDRTQQQQQRQARQQEQFQQQFLTFQQQSLAFMEHMLRHIGVPPFVPPVQQVGPAATTTLVTPAIQSCGLQSQGQLPAQFASPSLQFPQFFATPGTGHAQATLTAQQQTESLLVATTPATQSLSATFSENTGQPTPPLQVPVTTVAPVTGTTNTLPSSVASSEPPPSAG